MSLFEDRISFFKIVQNSKLLLRMLIFKPYVMPKITNCEQDDFIMLLITLLFRRCLNIFRITNVSSF